MCHAVNVGSEKSDILQAFLQGRLRPRPHPHALEVDADVVEVRMPARQSDTKVSLAAAEFQDDRIVIPEVGMPRAGQSVLAKDAIRSRAEFFELYQLVSSHGCKYTRSAVVSRQTVYCFAGQTNRQTKFSMAFGDAPRNHVQTLSF